MDLSKYLKKSNNSSYSPNLLDTFKENNKDLFEKNRLKEEERKKQWELTKLENDKNNDILRKKQALDKSVSSLTSRFMNDGQETQFKSNSDNFLQNKLERDSIQGPNLPTLSDKTRLRNEAEKQATDDFIAKNGPAPKGIFTKEAKAYNDKLWDETNKTNKSGMSEGTKKFYKNLDFLVEAPLRTPFINKILNSTEDSIAPGQSNGLNTSDIYKTKNSKNKILDGAGQLIGDTIGMGLNPAGATLPGKNLLNIADDVALQGSMKIAPKLGTSTLGKIGTQATRGAIDGGIGGVVDTMRQGQELKDLPGNVTMGAIGGGALFGGGKALGLAKEGIGNKVGKMFDDFGEPLKILDNSQKTGQPFKNPVNDGLSLVKKPMELPKIETPIKNPKMNIVNPAGKKFYQTMPDRTETTIHQQPKVSIRKEKVNVSEEFNTSAKLSDRENTSILSDKKVNAIQYDYPDLRPHIKQIANTTLGDIENAIPGKRFSNYNNETGETSTIGQKKMVEPIIQEIQSFVAGSNGVNKNGKPRPQKVPSYKSITKALEDIVEDNGKENYALAKKVEKVLVDNLEQGQVRADGMEIPANKDFIESKQMLSDMEQGSKINVNNTVFKGNIETPITKTIPGERVPIKQPLNIEPLPEIKKPQSVAAFKDSPTYAKMEIGEDELNSLIRQRVDAKKPIVEPPIDENFDVNAKPYNKIIDTKKEKTTFAEKRKNFYSRVFDDKTHIKDASEKAYMLATNTKSVGGTVDHISTKDLVDMKGNKIGEGFKGIVNDIPKDKEEVWKELIYQKHNISRAKEGKPIFYKDEKTPYTSKESELRYKLLSEENPELVKVADRFTKWIDTFMNEWGVKSGLTKEDIYNELRDVYPDYVPTQREFSQLEKGMPSKSTKGLLNVSTPVGEAKGSSRDVLNPIENVLNLINRTVRSARYNEVGQALLKEIEGNPSKMSKFAEVIPPKEGMFSNTDNVLSIMVEGKQKFIKVNDLGLLKSLQNVNTSQPNTVLDSINKYVSSPFKQLITQKNPLFALTNIARDLPTAYIYGSENNPLKFVKNLGGAVKDIVTDGENYNRYKAIGGGGGNFFKGSDIGKTVKELQGRNSIPKKFMNIIETFNNITETAPRLAEFNKIYKDTGDIQKALYKANDVTTNFSRGGDITKTADKVTPYLNAGVQGLDKLARQLNPKNPKQALETLIKGGVAITTPSLLLHYLNADNEDYKALDNRTKDNNFLIPTGDGKFIKIPKSRELGVLFGSLFERVSRAASGEEDSFKDFGNTVKTNISVNNPIEDNIARPIYDLMRNKDFANRPIVNQGMENMSKENQYDEKTTELSKFIGDKFKISPKQMDFLIKSYTGVIGTFTMPLATKSSYEGGIGKAMTKPITTKFVADPIYSNQATNDFYSNMDKISKKAADKNFNEKIPSKTVTEEEKMKSNFTKSSKAITDINKEIRNTTDEEKIRKLKRLAQEEMERVNKLYNKSKFK